MPPKSKINKQDILTSSLEIIRKSGFEEVNARSIAKEMNCSTNPIFRVYKNMDELKEELIEEVEQLRMENAYLKKLRALIQKGTKPNSGKK